MIYSSLQVDKIHLSYLTPFISSLLKPIYSCPFCVLPAITTRFADRLLAGVALADWVSPEIIGFWRIFVSQARQFCARDNFEPNGPIMLKLKLYDVYNNTCAKKTIFFDDLIFEICGEVSMWAPC